MTHEIRRVLRAFASQAWFIEPRKAEEIVGMLELRAAFGPRAEAYRESAAPRSSQGAAPGPVDVLNLFGIICQRATALDDVSQQTVSLERFQRDFQAAAARPNNAGIILNIDSPGGNLDFVPETVAMIRKARRNGRPIVAVANTYAASAAYWIACGCDEIVVTPSGEVGSIGVYMVHQDVSAAAEKEGVRITFVKEGPRKTEGNPFEPLSDEARGALQERVKDGYSMFVADVARGRGVSPNVVRADPEKGGKHFGGGRMYGAKKAVQLGMADRVATLDETVARLKSLKAAGGKTAAQVRSPTFW
ncbi:S49 family peptidase [Rhizobium sp. L43]|uniref:S49 family peptidase n=1 Tax=Rhizobium sp. L43 TaxID=2035452 RepID=UPI000BE906BE|nr:S49 family peptidase [Rhizobium sp. L43]PDS79160.1 peptidase S49 [Rhizobium sp. L43]